MIMKERMRWHKDPLEERGRGEGTLTSSFDFVEEGGILLLQGSASFRTAEGKKKGEGRGESEISPFQRKKKGETSLA